MAAKLAAVAARAVPPGTVAAGAEAGPSHDGVFPDVLQLDPYVVHEDRVPRFKARELLTAKGRLALARRRYPGLGPLTDAAALARLAEDFAQERRQEAADLKGLLELDGGKVSPDLKRKIAEPARLPSSLGPKFGESYRLPK